MKAQGVRDSVRENRLDFDARKGLLALESGKLDQKRRAYEMAFHAPDQLHGGGCRPARGDQVVDNEDALAGLEVLSLHLDLVA